MIKYSKSTLEVDQSRKLKSVGEQCSTHGIAFVKIMCKVINIFRPIVSTSTYTCMINRWDSSCCAFLLFLPWPKGCLLFLRIIWFLLLYHMLLAHFDTSGYKSLGSTWVRLLMGANILRFSGVVHSVVGDVPVDREAPVVTSSISRICWLSLWRCS